MSVNLDELEDWGTFSKREFKKPPSKRKAKRWINEGIIPGRIIDNEPMVYHFRYSLNKELISPANDSAFDKALEMFEKHG